MIICFCVWENDIFNWSPNWANWLERSLDLAGQRLTFRGLSLAQTTWRRPRHLLKTFSYKEALTENVDQSQTSFGCIRSFIDKQLSTFHFIELMVSTHDAWVCTFRLKRNKGFCGTKVTLFWESSKIWAYFLLKTRIARSIKCQFY